MFYLYNTLTRKKDAFRPIAAGKVGMYCCGPTVYNFAHIGNLRCYLAEDVLRRALEYAGFTVKHVVNITDVGHLTSDSDTGEDKMQKSAREQRKTAWDVAEQYTKAFKGDMQKLHILSPHVWCKATDHIKEQIAQVQALEKKGFTYVIDGDGVYYDTSKFPAYAELGRLNLEGLKAGARVEHVEGKRNPSDFALWKFSPKGEKRDMEWPSSWSAKGFPGWHIECSAMSMKYLGEHFDIHCGGIDHIQVHHTNEIAQAEGVTGKHPWVNYWVHVEFVDFSNEKMSKSKGNVLYLQGLIDKGFDPVVYRYYCVSAHYRTKMVFSMAALDGAKNALEKLKKKIIELKNNPESENCIPNVDWKEKFLDAIIDDVNTPQAFAVLWDMLKSDLCNRDKLQLALDFDRVFGLGMKDWQEDEVAVPASVQALVDARESARKAKDWAQADKLRAEILAKGFVLEDGKDGVSVRKRD